MLSTTKQATEDLRQHQLVILRRLRDSPLTEFELAAEIAEHSGHTEGDASGKMAEWLDELMKMGLIWAGVLFNKAGQSIQAAALTQRGRELLK